jgi:hypothetical protein
MDVVQEDCGFTVEEPSTAEQSGGRQKDPTTERRNQE